MEAEHANDTVQKSIVWQQVLEVVDVMAEWTWLGCTTFALRHQED